MRLMVFILLGLSIVFSFAVAVGDSQLFAAITKVTEHNRLAPGVFLCKQGATALALHWLAFVSTVGFFVGVARTHISISSVRVKVTPDDTAGSTGGRQYAAVGGQIEKASLLRDAEPMAIAPASLAPQAPQGGQPAGAMGMGMGMGMGGPPRGGMMAGRGGPLGRGGPMAARGGPPGMGAPMAARGRGM